MGFIKLEVAEDGGGHRRRTRRALAAHLQVEGAVARVGRNSGRAVHAKRRRKLHGTSAHRLELAERAARRHQRLAHVLQQLASRHIRSTEANRRIVRRNKRKRRANKRTARVRAGRI